MSLLSRLFPRAPAQTVDVADIAFDGPVYAVGDVHGCLDLYRQVEALALRDAEGLVAVATVVLLGDMVDRGPQSAALIDHLLAAPDSAARRLCLMGNHEAMMLDYLDDPRAGADWLSLGGWETLASYGLPPDVQRLNGMRLRERRQALAAHLPEGHIRFLRSLPCAFRVGPYLLAHAGADAAAPLRAQPRQALVWGSAGLGAPDGLTLVHGHYAAALPTVTPVSIGIDTGAYATGHLTVLRLMPGRAPATATAPQDQAFAEIPASQPIQRGEAFAVT